MGSTGSKASTKPRQQQRVDIGSEADGVAALEEELKRARELAAAQQSHLNMLQQDLELERRLAELDGGGGGEDDEAALEGLDAEDADVQLGEDELAELENELKELTGAGDEDERGDENGEEEEAEEEAPLSATAAAVAATASTAAAVAAAVGSCIVGAAHPFVEGQQAGAANADEDTAAAAAASAGGWGETFDADAVETGEEALTAVAVAGRQGTAGGGRGVHAAAAAADDDDDEEEGGLAAMPLAQ